MRLCQHIESNVLCSILKANAATSQQKQVVQALSLTFFSSYYGGKKIIYAWF